MVASCFMHAPLQCDCTVSLRQDRHVGSVGGGNGRGGGTRKHTHGARNGQGSGVNLVTTPTARRFPPVVSQERKRWCYPSAGCCNMCVCVCARSQRSPGEPGSDWDTGGPNPPLPPCVTDNGGLLPTSAATSTWCLERSERG